MKLICFAPKFPFAIDDTPMKFHCLQCDECSEDCANKIEAIQLGGYSQAPLCQGFHFIILQELNEQTNFHFFVT